MRRRTTSREMLTNRVIDVLRRSLRRQFPVIRDGAFDHLIEKLNNIRSRRSRSPRGKS